MTDPIELARIELRQWRQFVAVAEELHFGRAAARLSITQPPLSSALKALEEELGVRLLERDSKHVKLTHAGSAFHAEARQILELLVRAGETVRAVAGGLRGRLDIGFTGSMIYRDAPQIVSAFNDRMPGIEVTLREMSSGEQIESLLHGQLHAGFINAPTVPAGLTALSLREDVLVCCLPAQHPLAREEKIDLRHLAEETFVMFSREVAPANHDNVIAIFSRAGVHPRTQHAARQWLTIVALVSAGMGVSLVPASIAKAGIAGACFVPIKGQKTRSVGLLAWNAANHVPALDYFIETARLCETDSERFAR